MHNEKHKSAIMPDSNGHQSQHHTYVGMHKDAQMQWNQQIWLINPATKLLHYITNRVSFGIRRREEFGQSSMPLCRAMQVSMSLHFGTMQVDMPRNVPLMMATSAGIATSAAGACPLRWQDYHCLWMVMRYQKGIASYKTVNGTCD